MLQKKDEKQNLKIGVLLPQSKEYPEVGVNFLNGIKLYFTLHNNQFERGEAELLVEDVALGTERLALEKVRKLIAQDNVLMITGLLEFGVGLQVGLTTQMADVPTLFAGLGESTIPHDYIPDNLFFHTLQFWQAHFHLGKYVAGKFKGAKIKIVSSLLDCGYDHLRAFRLGLRAEGVEAAEEIVLSAYDVDELKVEVDEISISKNAVYVAILHPKLLNGFIDCYGHLLDVLISPPFYTGNSTLKKPWAAVLPDRSNPQFVKFRDGLKEYLDQEPDMFHVLGYQQGQIIYNALESLEGPLDDNKHIINMLSTFERDTIVGPSRMNKRDHTIGSTISVCEGININEDYKTLITIDEDVSAIDETKDLYLQKNAFTQPYLFF